MGSANRLCGLLLVVMVWGCSSEEDEAKDKCHELIATWCSEVIDCLVDNGDVASADKASELAACKDTGEGAVDCAAAVSVSGNYDSCMSSIRGTSCAQISAAVASDSLKLPQKCEGVIEVPE